MGHACCQPTGSAMIRRVTSLSAGGRCRCRRGDHGAKRGPAAADQAAATGATAGTDLLPQGGGAGASSFHRDRRNTSANPVLRRPCRTVSPDTCTANVFLPHPAFEQKNRPTRSPAIVSDPQAVSDRRRSYRLCGWENASRRMFFSAWSSALLTGSCGGRAPDMVALMTTY